MLPRFFAPDTGRGAEDSIVALPEDESAHLTRVLRLSPGARVRVFNGRGQEWLAEIVGVSGKQSTIRLLESAAPMPEPGIAITLALAVLKGDKMDDVVRDAVMMGVAAIQPLITERTEISLAAVTRSNRGARWQRIAVASVKQCGRAVVPAVAESLRLDDWLARDALGERLMLVEPGVATSARSLRELAAPRAATLLIGPEGGWTEAEVRRSMAAGATAVTLGALTLRADAAPLVAVTAVRALWNDL